MLKEPFSTDKKGPESSLFDEPLTWNQKALLALISTVFMLSVFIFGKFLIPRTKGIRIGTKNFTEQIILGEILAQYLETQLQLPVELQKKPWWHICLFPGTANRIT